MLPSDKPRPGGNEMTVLPNEKVEQFDVGLRFWYEQADNHPFAIAQISRITFVQYSQGVYKAL
jgi:hypothetical protein